MTTEIPHAKPGTFCPLWKKDKSKVCHTCEFWVRMYGRNPNPKDPHTVEMIDDWRCAISWLPVLATQQASEVFAVSQEIGKQREMVIPLLQKTAQAMKSATDAVEGLRLDAQAAASQRQLALDLPERARPMIEFNGKAESHG